MENKEYYTQTDLIDMGVTLTIIKKFLPEPCMLAKNSICKKYPIKLFSKERVNKLYDDEEFLKCIEKSNKRKEITKKSVITKISKTMEEYKDLKVEVKKVNNVVKLAIDSYNDFNLGYNYIGKDSDKEFLNRITVNYIRHNLTKYEKIIDSMYSKVGKQKVYNMLNEKVFEEIAIIYPEYKEECNRQLKIKTEELEWKV